MGLKADFSQAFKEVFNPEDTSKASAENKQTAKENAQKRKIKL